MSNMEERARTKMLLVKIEDIIKNKKYECMYDGCTAPAVKSHSQQRSGPLQSIAENGKVYRLNDDLQRSYQFDSGKFALGFSLKGIGESSIFRGFCTKHETLFSIFENDEINPQNHRQLCVLFYRTFCYEKARRRREIDRLDSIIKYGVNRPWFPRHSPSSGNSVSHTLLAITA